MSEEYVLNPGDLVWIENGTSSIRKVKVQKVTADHIKVEGYLFKREGFGYIGMTYETEGKDIWIWDSSIPLSQITTILEEREE